MDSITMVEELNQLKGEVAALRRENELLHQWLNQQKSANSSLMEMVGAIRQELVLTRGDAK